MDCHVGLRPPRKDGRGVMRVLIHGAFSLTRKPHLTVVLHSNDGAGAAELRLPAGDKRLVFFLERT